MRVNASALVVVVLGEDTHSHGATPSGRAPAGAEVRKLNGTCRLGRGDRVTGAVRAQAGSVFVGSPVSSAAWHRQPPKSISRSAAAARLGHPGGASEAVERLRLVPDHGQGPVADVLEPQARDRPGGRTGQDVPHGVDRQVAAAPAVEAGLGPVGEVVGQDVDDLHPAAEAVGGLGGDLFGLADLLHTREQRGAVREGPAVILGIGQFQPTAPSSSASATTGPTRSMLSRWRTTLSVSGRPIAWTTRAARSLAACAAARRSRRPGPRRRPGH